MKPQKGNVIGRIYRVLALASLVLGGLCLVLLVVADKEHFEAQAMLAGSMLAGGLTLGWMGAVVDLLDQLVNGRNEKPAASATPTPEPAIRPPGKALR